MHELQVVLTNRLEEKKKILRALEEFARANQLAEPIVQAADLALEEHVTNIINYGYPNEQPRQITVRLRLEQGDLLVEVVDDGQPFNPLDRPEVDTSLPLEQKSMGGLGVHLMRRFMDELRYRREADRNILTMRKRLASAAK